MAIMGYDNSGRKSMIKIKLLLLNLKRTRVTFTDYFIKKCPLTKHDSQFHAHGS